MQTVSRALNILRLLASEPHGLSLSEISRRLKVAPASTHRIVSVLEKELYVTRSHVTRRIYLGPTAKTLTESYRPLHADKLVTPHASIRRANDACGETVFLSERVQNRVICLAIVESRFDTKPDIRIGQELSINETGAEAILAWCDEQIVRSFASAEFSSETQPMTDFLRRLDDVRRRGYAVGPLAAHAPWSVSAPIVRSTGTVVASVTITAPYARMSDTKGRECVTESVLTAATEIGSDLGWTEEYPNP
ncbi:IclR family transcriptional regulator [Nocardia vinacea]|uniref:IclR family transcriptional regulator n=1 Tax=Nocardia vinacea TaxID=96468 RepID=UPI003AF24B8F